MATASPVAATLEEVNETIARFCARSGEQEAPIGELEARLAQKSSNSSRSPSTDARWNKPKRKPPEEPSGRKAGGQPGHFGRTREPVPPEQVLRIVDVMPERSSVYGKDLLSDTPDKDTHAHQVTEIEPGVTVTVRRKRCPHCGGRTRANRPDNVPKEAFNPRLKATIVLLSARFWMSRREVVEALLARYGVAVSVGSVQAACEDVSDAVAPALETIDREVEGPSAVHADEKHWK